MESMPDTLARTTDQNRASGQNRSLWRTVAASAALGVLLGLVLVAVTGTRRAKEPANTRVAAAHGGSPTGRGASIQAAHLADANPAQPPSPVAPLHASTAAPPQTSPAPPPSLLRLDDAGASGIFFLRKGDIWVTNLDGSDQKQLTHSGRIEEYFWVPKSQTLVYHDSLLSRKQDVVFETINTLDMATQKVETIHKATIEVRCTEDLCADYFFSMDVSADGKIIFGEDFLGDAAESKREGVPKEGISRVIFHPDTRQYESTTEIPGSARISFLPNGSVAGWADDGNIYTYSFETKTRTQWTHYPSVLEDYKKHLQAGGAVDLPTAFDFIGWSPGASRVFFTCGTARTVHNVVNACETSLENAEVKKLSTDMTEVNPRAAFAMAPDGSFFYFQLFYSQFDGRTVEKIDTSTGENVSVKFNFNSNSPEVPMFSPSGKVLLFRPYPDFSPWLTNADGSNPHRILTDAQDFQWRY
jgi:hypothetical protein